MDATERHPRVARRLDPAEQSPGVGLQFDLDRAARFAGVCRQELHRHGIGEELGSGRWRRRRRRVTADGRRRVTRSRFGGSAATRGPRVVALAAPELAFVIVRAEASPSPFGSVGRRHLPEIRALFDEGRQVVEQLAHPGQRPPAREIGTGRPHRPPRGPAIDHTQPIRQATRHSSQTCEGTFQMALRGGPTGQQLVLRTAIDAAIRKALEDLGRRQDIGAGHHTNVQPARGGLRRRFGAHDAAAAGCQQIVQGAQHTGLVVLRPKLGELPLGSMARIPKRVEHRVVYPSGQPSELSLELRAPTGRYLEQSRLGRIGMVIDEQPIGVRGSPHREFVDQLPDDRGSAHAEQSGDEHVETRRLDLQAGAQRIERARLREQIDRANRLGSPRHRLAPVAQSIATDFAHVHTPQPTRAGSDRHCPRESSCRSSRGW